MLLFGRHEQLLRLSDTLGDGCVLFGSVKDQACWIDGSLYMKQVALTLRCLLGLLEPGSMYSKELHPSWHAVLHG